MNAQAGNSSGITDQSPAMMEIGPALAALPGEEPFATVGQRRHQLSRRGTQRDLMRLILLGACGWLAPHTLPEIKLIPRSG
jgi:hypothetical protein